MTETLTMMAGHPGREEAWRIGSVLASCSARGISTALLARGDRAADVAAITYGDRDTARRAARRVRAVHERVRGTDTVTGLCYAATDPALLLWVHATLVDSALAATGLFGTPLPPPDADRYADEMTVAAELAGAPRDMIPSDAAALARYMTTVRPRLRGTPAAAEVLAWLLDPPGMEEELAGLWQDVTGAAVTALLDWARDM